MLLCLLLMKCSLDYFVFPPLVLWQDLPLLALLFWLLSISILLEESREIVMVRGVNPSVVNVINKGILGRNATNCWDNLLKLSMLFTLITLIFILNHLKDTISHPWLLLILIMKNISSIRQNYLPQLLLSLLTRVIQLHTLLSLLL